MLRAILLFTLIFSLVPSVGEVVEMVVHRAVEGHWAHSALHHDDQPGSGEHGCSPLGHLCHCCRNQVVEREEPSAFLVSAPLAPIPPVEAPEAPLDVSLEPPFRPPIA